jgi:sugar phosphate isomerase/epimerase
MAHPRISVNVLSALLQPFADDITMLRDLGIDHVGIMTPKMEAVGWDKGRDMIRAAGLRVSNIAGEARVLTEAIELAAATGASVAYICSGGAKGAPWRTATAAFADMMSPHVARANELGVRLAVEPTNPLRTDVSFVFTLRDAADLARATGIGVVLDVYSCWYERDLDAVVRDNLDLLALVQISDFVIGTLNTPNRAVIGDGDIPLERLLGMVLEAGYGGAFDLEILGPRIEEEGYASAIRRSVDRASEILGRLHA